MKLAIVQDDLMRRGGAEQVTLSFHKAFPDAPIYTLCYQPELTYPEFKTCTVKTSWYQNVATDESKMKKFFFPIGLIAMSQLNIEGYDVVLMSTTFCAKYVKIPKGTLVITYCHTPFRLAWRPESYESVAGAKGLKKIVYNTVISILRNIDRKSAQKTDYFITNAKEIVDRIRHAYDVKNEIVVINPGVKTQNFKVSSEIKDYYLVVSRFEPYKKVDLIVKSFNENGKQLIIVGNGSKADELKAMAKKNITFKSRVSKEELCDLFSKCKALIFPQLEDYGITPLEANASGRPVIAYGKGGVLETMIPYTKNAKEASALFFEEQTEASLMRAIELFEQLEFDPVFIRNHAEKFDEQVFVKKIQNFVSEKFIAR